MISFNDASPLMYFSARQVLKAKGKEGSVEIKAKLAGYHQDVLDRLGIQDAVSLILTSI